MSRDVASQGDEDLQGTSIGRKPLFDAHGTKDEQQRYAILKRVGEGGFGAVYSAEDTFTNHRRVAIKAIHLAGLSPQQIIEATDSFNREVKLLTALHHPLLPRVYDHFTDASHWYMVMDFIEGETLDAYLEQRKRTGKELLPLEDVLDIARQLCGVLEYLHDHDPPVIFRDLKPGNIMVSPTGQLHLIDFGIARHFKPGKMKDTIPLGSPGYAAPEQYGRAQTSPSADIYSLGALLHYLLTGHDPSEDPFNFSTLPPELDPLGKRIMQMLARDPMQRPLSIAAVRRVIDGPAYTDGLTPVSPAQSTAAASPATASARPRQGVAGRQKQPRAAVRPRQPVGGRSRQHQLYAHPVRRRRRGGLTRRQAIASLSVIGGVWLVGMGFATRSFWQQLGLSQLTVLPMTVVEVPTPAPEPPTPTSQLPADLFHTRYIYEGHQAGLDTVAWSPVGDLVASGDSGTRHQLLVWHPISGKTIALPGQRAAISQVVWSPDGKRLAATAYDHTMKVWEPTTGTLLYTRQGPAPAGGLSWSPDGKRLAIAFNNAQMQVCSSQSDKLMMSYDGYNGRVDTATARRCVIAWSPDGQHIASGAHDATLQVWSASTGQMTSIFRDSTTNVTGLAWSPDGASIAFCSGQLFIWRPASGDYQRTIESGCTCVAWSPDGKRIAYAINSLVQVINASTGEMVFTYRGHSDIVEAVAWSPDSKWVASGSNDKTVRLWSPDPKNVISTGSFVPTVKRSSGSW